jgi:hypothetical protein
MMLKILAGDLSATWNIDGQHFDRFVARRPIIMQSICDQLLLHDQILIPTSDYVTLAGLVHILGERNLLTLLGEERLAFVRLRGAFGYVRGTNEDGRLISFEDPTKKLPNSAPIQQSIEAGLSFVQNEIKERRRLINSAFACTTELDLQIVIDATHRDAYRDLSQTNLWKPEYDFPNPDLIALPGMTKMQVRVLGPGTDVSNNVVDACLALGLMNAELYLTNRFNCVSSATGAPMEDCIALKIPRLTIGRAAPASMWSFMEYASIPNIATPLSEDRDQMAKFIKLTRGRDAEDFRRWFHASAGLSEKELVRAYINLLHDTPVAQEKPGKVLRMAMSLGLSAIGLGLAADAAVSAIDNFVVDKYIRNPGAKFFIENLRTFSGKIAQSACD